MQTSHRSSFERTISLFAEKLPTLRFRKVVVISILALAGLASGLLYQAGFRPVLAKPPVPGQANVTDDLTKSAVREMLSQMPMTFEANQGQTSPEVKYLSRGSGYTMFLTANEAVMRLEKNTQNRNEKARAGKTQSDVLRMKLIGANEAPQVSAAGELPAKVNYLKGNDPAGWGNTALYERVKYTGVYPGIDLVWYGNQRMLEYDFIVASGASPDSIRLSFSGQKQLHIAENGDLVISLAGGDVRQPKPFIYQERDGRRQQIAGNFVLKGKQEAGFEIAAYDTTLPLVIDPNLTYATYLGGDGDDMGWGIAVDGNGFVYIVGETTSTDFPVVNEYQGTNTGGAGTKDVFVSKIDPSLGATTPLLALVWSTYLGGSDDDTGRGIAVNSSGQVFITGYTGSTNFPTLNQFQGDQGGTDVFIARLDTTQTGAAVLQCSTYLGGGGEDFADAIAIDSSNNAYITGRTLSATFPTLNQLQLNQPLLDAFATKLSLPVAGASTLAYSTYLGGNDGDYGKGIAVDAAGLMYVTGYTLSSDYPRQNEYQANQPFADVFVTKLDPTQSGNASLLWSSYIGGESDDEGHAIAVGSSGIVYVTGRSESIGYPLLNHYATKQADSDVVLTKLDTTKVGSAALLWSSYLGGNNYDTGESIAVDSAGNAYLTGFTQSTNFPLKDQTQGHPGDTLFNAFVAKLDTTKTGTAALNYSTYYGGVGEDKGQGIAIDSLGNAFITGSTLSPDLPVITPYQSSQAGMGAFIARFSPPGFSAPPTIIPGGGVTRLQGSLPGSAVTIANVSDDVTPAGSLIVEVMTAPAGISITSITNTNGTVTAQVSASCTATLGLNVVVLKVTDGGGRTATANFNVTVTENTAPALGNYPSRPVAGGGTVTSTPDAVPSDNGTIVELKAVAVEASFNGSLSVNPTTGVVTVTNAGIGGTYTINVSAKDNCNAVTLRSFVLTVDPACSFSLPVNSKVVGPVAAAYTANVTATTGCRWTAVSNDPWITITAGANSTGSGTFTFNVTANTAGTRTGTITVAGVTYTVTQTTNDLSVDSDNDGMPDALEPGEGLNYLVKDNDVYTNNRWFVMQMYRDYLHREAAEPEIGFWTGQMTGGLTRPQVADTIINSPEFSNADLPVIRLYIGILNRYPDYPIWLGHVLALKAGTPLTSVAQIFVDSLEFTGLYGSSGSLSNTDYVTLLYGNVLNRTPSPAEVSYWVGVLNSGATRGAVLASFTESAEFKNASDNEVFVIAQYLCLLRRTPDIAEVSFWTSALGSGLTRQDAINGFLNSAEYHSRVLP